MLQNGVAPLQSVFAAHSTHDPASQTAVAPEHVTCAAPYGVVGHAPSNNAMSSKSPVPAEPADQSSSSMARYVVVLDTVNDLLYQPQVPSTVTGVTDPP